jgi:hypothetical protein
VLSLENELRDLGASETRIAADRREIFSLYYELRVLLYAAVTMIVAGVGLYLKRNLYRIGPLALIAGIAVVAAACYAFVQWRRSKPSLAHDYLLLLGALLVSADVGYAETQFHMLDDRWSWHLLLLAIFHAASAYWFDSRVLLSVSITSLAAFLGIQPGMDFGLYAGPDLGVRMFICAAILLAWRFANRREPFQNVFHHAIALLALAASLILVFDDSTRWIGFLIAVPLAALTIRWGWTKREFAFLVYGVIALLIAVGNVITEVLDVEAVTLLYFLVSTIGAIVFLFWSRMKMQVDR